MDNHLEQSTESLVWGIRARIIGVINPSLRGIAAKWDGNSVVLYYYHDGRLDDEVKEHYSCISAEVIADYSTAKLREYFESIPYPEPLPSHENWAYLRKEPFEDPEGLSLDIPLKHHKTIWLDSTGKPQKIKRGELEGRVREALLSNVIPSLRGVLSRWMGNTISLRFYHDGEVTDAIKRHYTGIGNVVASLYDASLNIEIISCIYPWPLPRDEYWTYKRLEPFEDPSGP